MKQSLAFREIPGGAWNLGARETMGTRMGDG